MESTSETNQLLLPSSSSSLPRCWHYDVFLSFRGEDTRKSFTDHLFAALCRAGVHTFRDAEELRKGEDISTDLIKAIQESKISIIVFSKTYASSRWCLEEVVKIVECKEMANQVVFPIFYDVSPSEVRKQTGGFADAFSQHQQRFKPEKVSQWKTALNKVADFSGWNLQNYADGYESKFIDKIVENVLQVVNRTYLNVAKYPVGIHARIRNILSFLQSEANDDVSMIGIYGLGGVGKTTLAKAVFNQIYRTFDGSCFLGDVGKEYVNEGHLGLKRLQEQLLCRILNRKRLKVDHVDEGISLIKERLGLKKVLIVVDDVDHESQLDSLVGDRNWFGSGSAIVVTTRNANLLNGFGKDCEKYNVAMLSHEESLQLFSWHAFKNPNPVEPFIELSNMIVSYAGGLPLALTVLGSHFRARSSVQEWSNDFEKLRRIPHNDILKILKISYDALDDDTQGIFLDIACIFTGEYFDTEEIVKILNGCGFFAQSGISTLIDRCLISEDLYMHGLVRDVGREIVRGESPRQPEKRSRLFLRDEVMDVLVNKKGTKAIETMIIDLPNEVHLSTKVFSKMTRLRVLKILSMNVKGPLKYLSNELRLLYWKNCPLRGISSDLCLKRLVSLSMIESNIEEFQPNLQHFRCLEILRLDDCVRLEKGPNFTGAHSLKTLSLNYCSNLVELAQSIGDLENLVNLYMTGCINVRELPSSICKLKSLRCLVLRGCSKIKELPTDLGKLEQLRYLNARGTSVTHLPSSCGSLRYLSHLELRQGREVFKSMERIGHSTSSDAILCSLQTLDAPYHSLQHLDLQTGLGSSSSLKCLDLSYSNFDALPFNLFHLSQLRWLKLNNCQNLRVIQNLPITLYHLSAKKCPLLENVQDLSGLGLSVLDLSNCNSLVEFRGVENLVYLDKLDLSHLSQLRHLRLDNCQNLRVIRDLPISLHELSAKNCPLLENIQDLCELLELRHLYLSNCSNLVELPGLENLVCLEHIHISHNYFDQPQPFNLCLFSQLQDLKLNHCQNLRAIQDLPPSLHILSALNCPLLENIQDLSSLLELGALNLSNCSNLIELPGLENLIDLEYIDIRNCSALSSKSWCVNFFKARFKNPTQFTMKLSKDMVPQYLCSNEVVGCSSSYTLPLFLKKKQILFIVVMISCLFGGWCYVKYKTTAGKELTIGKMLQVHPPHVNDMGLECEVYGYFAEPNEVKKLEVLIEFYLLEHGEEEKLSIETCIVYEEEGVGEVYFLPINLNKAIKFHPHRYRGAREKTAVVTITHC
ncbi:TMV resistance protein N-like [Ipomoea triloba]|uniref:TMV resistance protein N-like n=1 Tax=Ipomoea triloba TaxID=35885 RepID=UPI00125D74A8|nr:TMV resistance protein N-like [Ipomoea triloba]